MIPFLVNGLVIGAIYGIVALGVVLVYKGSRAVNFAHGEMGMIAAFVVLSLWSENGWNFFLAAAIGLVCSGLTGFLTERLVVRRFEDGSTLTILVATLAVAGVLQFIGAEIWGLEPKFIQAPVEQIAGWEGIRAGEIVLTIPRLIVIFAALVASAGIAVLFRRTSFGLAFRGTAIDGYAAKLCGINVRRVSSATWTLGAVLSGLAAILVAPLVSFHVFFMTLLFIRALAAALVAGLTNLGAAFVAGITIGVAESLLIKYTSQAGAVEAALFALIVLLLAVRPKGLFAAEY
ncbi:MAG: branched-chain amino acid ABC transporter permease [Actinomycetota bacterium]